MFVLLALLLSLPSSAADKSGIEWVSLPGGHFAMGSERWPDAKPVHQVAVKPFQIAKFPVTNTQYRACVTAGACSKQSVKCATAAFTNDDQPIVCVTWDQAAAFSRWAGGRLPSEAEWE
ncbi:MAG: formylglycine-generating enzyme family protein, partial [Elusimicrobiota bacterium]